MSFCLQKEGSIEYILSIEDIKKRFPNISFKRDFNESIPEIGLFKYEFTQEPDYNLITQYIERGEPVFDEVDEVYKEVWFVKENSPQQIANEITYFAEKHTMAVQIYMDDFAKTRNYDNIQSAVTYIGCGIPKFEAEGQYCLEMRAQIWSILYQYMSEVEEGARVMETDSQKVIDLLPMLSWPV